MDRHLGLSVMGIKEKDKSFFLKSIISPPGLFGNAICTIINRYQVAKLQLVVFSIVPLPLGLAPNQVPCPEVWLRGSGLVCF